MTRASSIRWSLSIIFLFRTFYSVDSFSPTLRSSALNPRYRKTRHYSNPIDEILDFLEGKAGYTGPTEQQLLEADDEKLKQLSSTFDDGPKNSTPAYISTGFIAFLVITPVLAMSIFRYFNPDNIIALNV